MTKESDKMAVKVAVIFDNRQDKSEITLQLKNKLRRVCKTALENEGLEGLFEISLTFVDNEQIRELNRDYRDKDSATDVLSFPLSEDGETFDVDADNGAYLLGDIVISVERAISQAEEYGHSVLREIAFLTAHSMLHLLGYDHEENAPVPEEKGEEAMKRKQEEILQKLKITRETENA